MLQGEHSAILSTFIKLQFAFKTFVLSIFEWPLKTGFTVERFFKVLPHTVVVLHNTHRIKKACLIKGEKAVKMFKNKLL